MCFRIDRRKVIGKFIVYSLWFVVFGSVNLPINKEE